MPPLPLHRIPLQTGANCGLFAVIAGSRVLGYGEEDEARLAPALDRLEKADPRTFIGEVLSVDLLLDLIRGLSQGGAGLFSARSVAFSTPAELSELIRESAVTGGALLIPFARPQSYDVYYRLVGQNATETEIRAARKAKEAESLFLPADAHWALINRMDETGQIVLADSVEDVWGRGHGYEATFTAEKLTAANLALKGCFDWRNFLDGQGRVWGMGDLLGKPYAPSTPRLKNPERLERILSNAGREALDLAGRVLTLERERMR